MKISLLIKTLLVVFVFVTKMINPCFSQNGNPDTWSRIFSGDRDMDEPLIIKTNDGGMALTGKIKNSENFDAFFILKFSGDGHVEWEKIFENTEIYSIFAFIQTKDNGFVLGGLCNMAVEFSDAFVMKCDNKGAYLWHYRYSGNLDECIQGLAEDAEGNIIAVGSSSTAAFKHNTSNGLVLKLDKNGKIIWQKNYGQNSESFYDIYIEKDAYVLCGITETFGAGFEDFFIMKIKYDGTIIWQKAYGNKGAENGHVIRKLPDGNYIFAGGTNSFRDITRTSHDLWVVKTDNSGNLIWDLLIADAPPPDILFSSLEVMADGGILLAGTGMFKSPSFGRDNHLIMIKIGSDGKLVYQKRFNSKNSEIMSPNANSLVISDSWIFFCIQSISFNSDIRQEIVLAKINETILANEKNCDYQYSSPGIKMVNATGKVKPNILKPFDVPLKEIELKISSGDVSDKFFGK